MHPVPGGQLLGGPAARPAGAGEGSEADLDKLLDICDNITGRAFCALGDSIQAPVGSSIQYFRDEYLEHLRHGGCPFDPAASTLFAMESAR